jgi:ornithine--oxo-acid transaminase
MAKGVLSKETHDTVVRLAPPLVIAREDLDFALDRFEEVLRELCVSPRHHPVAA